MFVAVPCQDTWRANTVSCIAACLLFTREVRPDIRLRFVQERGTILQNQRAVLAREALASGATHIMWFDADMTFPPDAILRLLDRRKPLVGANYSTRRAPYEPTAKSLDTKSFVYTDHLSSGLEPAVAMGFGCMLTETSVFTALSEPWFDITAGYDEPDGRRHHSMGEDYWFCYLAGAELGIHPWVDHDLSKLVGHVGEKVCSFEDALGDRAHVRLIRSHVLERPPERLPHHLHQKLADLDGKFDADALQGKRDEYTENVRQREEAEEAAILAAHGLSEG